VNHIRARAATEPGAAKRRAEYPAMPNRNSASILSEHSRRDRSVGSQKRESDVVEAHRRG
jgi:hypothetical protein